MVVFSVRGPPVPPSARRTPTIAVRRNSGGTCWYPLFNGRCFKGNPLHHKVKPMSFCLSAKKRRSDGRAFRWIARTRWARRWRGLWRRRGPKRRSGDVGRRKRGQGFAPGFAPLKVRSRTLNFLGLGHFSCKQKVLGLDTRSFWVVGHVWAHTHSLQTCFLPVGQMAVFGKYLLGFVRFVGLWGFGDCGVGGGGGGAKGKAYNHR